MAINKLQIGLLNFFHQNNMNPFNKLWMLNLRLRVLLAALFYSGNKYTFSEILLNIIESHKISLNEFPEAKKMGNRYNVLRFALNSCEEISGDVLEFGVYKGSTLKFIAECTGDNQTVYGFDSFNGLPEDWGTILNKGDFKTKIPDFSNYKNIILRDGLFRDTLPRFLSKNRKIKFIHLDCDLYNSAYYVLNNSIDKVSNSGAVVFDEYYGYPGYKDHEYRAWHEIVEKYKIKFRAIAYSSHSAAFQIIQNELNQE